MILGIDPKVDYAFKYMLGRDSTRAILIDVLNKVLQPPAGHEVVEVELLNPFNHQEALDDKLSILDIKARDQTSRVFNIEMQMLASPHYQRRVLYYWAKLYQQQLHQGDDYLKLRPTISISFLDHVLFPDVPDYHLKFHLLEDQHHFSMTDDIEFHIIQLPKFTKSLSKLQDGLDIWLYFLRFAEKIDPAALPTVLQQPSIVRAVEELTMLTQTDIERERYEARLKAQLDHNTLTRYAREQEQYGREQHEQLEIALEHGKIALEKGEMIGVIHTYERMLTRPKTPKEQLLVLSLDDLKRLAEDLEKQSLNGR